MGQAVEHHEQLHQQRRAADHPDVKAGQLAQHRHFGELHQRHGHRNDQRDGKGDRSQRNGHGQAREQDLPKGFHQQVA